LKRKESKLKKSEKTFQIKKEVMPAIAEREAEHQQQQQQEQQEREGDGNAVS
jgi:hypothetical protein